MDRRAGVSKPLRSGRTRPTDTRLKTWRTVAVLVLCAGTGTPDRAAAQQVVYSTDEVKAAFLYHFGTYVEWPSEVETVTITVLGAPGVASALARFLPGRMIQGRPARFRRLAEIGDLADDQILFIGADRNEQLADLVAAIADRPVLVVTDSPDGLGAGSIVNFRVVDRQVRFEVSLPAAESAGLRLSSRLLSAAMRIETAHTAFPATELARLPDARRAVPPTRRGGPPGAVRRTRPR